MYNNNQKVKHSDASAQMAITLKAKNDYLHHFKILTHFIGQSGHETKFRNQTNDFKPFLKKTIISTVNIKETNSQQFFVQQKIKYQSCHIQLEIWLLKSVKSY